jgi:hypothetical protein
MARCLRDKRWHRATDRRSPATASLPARSKAVGKSPGSPDSLAYHQEVRAYPFRHLAANPLDEVVDDAVVPKCPSLGTEAAPTFARPARKATYGGPCSFPTVGFRPLLLFVATFRRTTPGATGTVKVASLLQHVQVHERPIAKGPHGRLCHRSNPLQALHPPLVPHKLGVMVVCPLATSCSGQQPPSQVEVDQQRRHVRHCEGDGAACAWTGTPGT